MKKFQVLLAIILSLAVIAGCSAPNATPAPTDAPVEPTTPVVQEPTATEAPVVNEYPLYVNLTWHQHQPMYYKDENGVYTRPWVRVHATKDYLDMAEMIAAEEGVKAAVNLTPSLIRQIQDFTDNGAKDLYWVLAEVPAAELTVEQKTFILQRFYDANWDHIIAVHPRYKELLDLRGGTDEAAIAAAVENFTEQDFRDLQIWFNLAWIDPDYLAQEPFKTLVDKGRDFVEEDKVTLFGGILELIQRVLPTHKELQDVGLLEITTTPYAHPILPLIYDSDLALVGNPKAIMPKQHFSYPEDAAFHLQKSVEMYETIFGREVRGLWPGEGSVAEEIVPLVSEAGYKWIQTGEPVLVASLGLAGDRFARDNNGVVKDPDTFYRPYFVQGESGDKVGIFFRDWVISDKIGFNYSGMAGEAAAQDMIGSLEAIYESLKGTEGPHIVTIVVDGENAWENYDNDGKDFFHALYKKLAESKVLETITPSEYLELYPEQRELDVLFPGAWFSANYDTWIGESEEAEGWDLLARVRADLKQYEDGTLSASPEGLAEAQDFMYLAEGSDWFWWYGTDQDSGQDSYFDEGYRALLKGVYTSLGVEYPAFLDIPVIQPQPLKADVAISGEMTAVVDGTVGEDEWSKSAVYAGAEAAPIQSFAYGMNMEDLFLQISLAKAFAGGDSIEVYLNAPGDTDRQMADLSASGHLLAPASRVLEIKPGQTTVGLYMTDGATWTKQEGELGQVAVSAGSVEVQLSKTILGEASNGNVIPMQVILRQGDAIQLNSQAPLAIQYFSFEPVTSVLLIEDPEGDDKGPGSYTYPKDGVFKAGDFDLTAFEVSSDGANIYFSFTLKAPITNGWSSAGGFSVQTFDVYIDKDPGAGTGNRMLLPGRNAALADGNGWDVAVWIEGWAPYYQVLVPGDDPLAEPVKHIEASSAMKVYVDSGKNAVIASVPLEFFGEGTPGDWSYAAVVLGQEGYPADGVWRVRDVNKTAESYRFGGAPLDNNHTRIIDVALPVDFSPDQATLLSTYPSSAQPVDGKGPDDFAIIPLIAVSK